MAILGIELCDAGFQAADNDGDRSAGPLLEGSAGPLEWLGLAYHDGQKDWFGPSAEEAWFVRPKQVSHDFWGRLSRETSSLGPAGKPYSFSQLAYFSLRDYYERVASVLGQPERLVLAVPGEYLKDETTENERIGLLLGMVAELQLPLVSIMDMACAAFCDPRLGYFDRSLPVLVVDMHLHGAELTLLQLTDRLVRREFSLLPHAGYAELGRQMMSVMGNRFLRHTTFDIQEDGRIEQVFYRQTKDFLLSGDPVHHYQINTGNRTYEMNATREQLAGDVASFTQSLVTGAQALLKKSERVRPDLCTIALTARAALLPGITARFRAAGHTRFLHLPAGAAAVGAARMGAEHPLLDQIADVPVETSVPHVFIPQRPADRCVCRVIKAGRPAPGHRPSHAICEGIGHDLAGVTSFVIGSSQFETDLVLPDDFNAEGEGCRIRLELADGKWWLVGTEDEDRAERTLLESGDRLTLHLGSSDTEVLFAHCLEQPARRHHP